MSKYVLLVVVVMALCAQAVPVPQFGYNGFGPLWNPFNFMPSFPNVPNYHNQFQHFAQSGGVVGSGGVGGVGSFISTSHTSDSTGSGGYKSMVVTSNSKDGKTTTYVVSDDNGQRTMKEIKS